MSNLDFWYFFGVATLGLSFAYITLLAVQFMGVGKKEQKTSAPGSSNTPPVRFVLQALLAVWGLMIGAQFLQYHQDQEQLAKKAIVSEMAKVSILSNKTAGASGSKRMNARPTARPPRGEFSLSETGTAGSAVDKNSRGNIQQVPATVTPIVNPFTPSE